MDEDDEKVWLDVDEYIEDGYVFEGYAQEIKQTEWEPAHG